MSKTKITIVIIAIGVIGLAIWWFSLKGVYSCRNSDCSDQQLVYREYRGYVPEWMCEILGGSQDSIPGADVVSPAEMPYQKCMVR